MKHINLTYLFLLFVITGTQPLQAQRRPQSMDLVTMTNGYQLLGKIIEQRPGIDIRLYRPVENDTLTLQQDSIEKIAVVQVNRFAEKKVNAKDTSLDVGRFNTKNNVYSISWIMSDNVLRPQWGLEKPDSTAYWNYWVRSNGLDLGYMRSIRNTFFWGGSIAVMKKQLISYINDDPSYHYNSWGSIKVMLECKVRLSRRMQSKRFTVLYGLAAGDHLISYWRTYNHYITRVLPDGQQVSGFERSSLVSLEGHKLTVQSSLTLKINPDNTSGISIEPFFAYSRPEVTTIYNNYRGNQGLKATVISRHDLTAFGIRIGYFF